MPISYDQVEWHKISLFRAGSNYGHPTLLWASVRILVHTGQPTAIKTNLGSLSVENVNFSIQQLSSFISTKALMLTINHFQLVNLTIKHLCLNKICFLHVEKQLVNHQEVNFVFREALRPQHLGRNHSVVKSRTTLSSSSSLVKPMSKFYFLTKEKHYIQRKKTSKMKKNKLWQWCMAMADDRDGKVPCLRLALPCSIQ